MILVVVQHVAELELETLIGLVERRQPADALACITEAEAVVADLSRLGERLVGYYVERARNDGHSWTDIGEHVGVTRQAAQQRFAGRWTALTMGDLDHAGAFERVTARARDALLRADAHARRLGHDAVEVEHVLLAVLDDRTTLASRALQAIGADVAGLKKRLSTPRRQPSAAGATSDLPVSGVARRCITRALDEALSFGHNYIGTEHLLLAAIDDPATTKILARCGVGRDATRAAVDELLDAYSRQRE